MEKQLSNRAKTMELIVKFFENHEGNFHAYELRDYIIYNSDISPHTYMDTTLRCMRELRQRKVINYETVGEKRFSLYKIIA